MKKCYSLTYIGPNTNGGSDFRINSTIWLRAGAGGGPPLAPEELIAYANFIETEIRTVYSTANNPGLSKGNGPYTYNGTNDTFTCDPPAVPSGRDTGVVVSDIVNRPTPLANDRQLEQNEIVFTVLRNRPPRSRAYIDPRQQVGQLFYYQQGALPIAPGTIINYNVAGNDVFNSPFYLDVHNTAAHEFGHALGLKDRYHILAFGHVNGQNANTQDGPNSSRNYIVRHGGGDVPMYLPGLYDRNQSGYPSSFVEQDPPYAQDPYLDPAETPNNIGQNTPQPDFDPSTPGHLGPYDIDYTSRFGWEHNIMSKRFGVNHPDPAVPANVTTKFDGQYTTAGYNAEPLYQNIYGLDIGAGMPEVVLITETQTKVITDTGGATTNLPAIGGEIISKRFEDERAESDGYPKGMFDQHIFILSHPNTFGASSFQPMTSIYIGVNDPTAANGDPAFRGVPPATLAAILGQVSLPTDANREFYNTKSGGTFVGLNYDNRLDRDGNGAIVVSDWDFDETTYPSVLGFTDCMDYRMCVQNDNPSLSNYKSWTPRDWPVGGGTASGHFYGFMNPDIAARRSPKSNTKSFELLKINIFNRIKNTEIENLSNSFFNGWPANFSQGFNNGADEINIYIVAFGSADPMRFVQRVLEQSMNPTGRLIIDGKFRRNLNRAGVIRLNEVRNEDPFADVGIMTSKARAIWNATRDDYVPPMLNPGPGQTATTPPPTVGGTYNLPNGVIVTPWTTGGSDGFGRYIIQFDSTAVPGSRLLDEYTMWVSHFSNRDIIEIMITPS